MSCQYGLTRARGNSLVHTKLRATLSLTTLSLSQHTIAPERDDEYGAAERGGRISLHQDSRESDGCTRLLPSGARALASIRTASRKTPSGRADEPRAHGGRMVGYEEGLALPSSSPPPPPPPTPPLVVSFSASPLKPPPPWSQPPPAAQDDRPWSAGHSPPRPPRATTLHHTTAMKAAKAAATADSCLGCWPSCPRPAWQLTHCVLCSTLSLVPAPNEDDDDDGRRGFRREVDAAREASTKSRRSRSGC